MKNLLINFSFGDKCIDSLEGEIFLDSLSKFNSFDKAVFVNQVSDHNIEKLSKYFDIIIKNNESMFTCYIALYTWLTENADKYDYVLHSDLRDVIIQEDPFNFFISNPDKGMFYSLEGMLIKENDCNLFWEKRLRTILRSHNGPYENEQVINGGIFGGKIDFFLNHCLSVFSNTNRNNEWIVFDQQFLGYLGQFLKKNPYNMMCHPYSDTFACTGEAIKRNNIEIQFINGKACNMKGEPYHIFHQWDRTKYAEEIRNKHRRGGLTFKI